LEHLVLVVYGTVAVAVVEQGLILDLEELVDTVVVEMEDLVVVVMLELLIVVAAVVVLHLLIAAVVDLVDLDLF
jgi:hypothetical protein